ncbi:MAG: peroxiredoxin family protein [Salinibacter sp.]|uniref:peroxiredoxin family protein n=1 Tax=Salinibacter sp. TaxID=2065818 RepID=UPI0035D3DCDE
MSRLDAPSTFSQIWGSSAVRGLLLFGLFVLGVSCQQSGPGVQSYLAGRVTLASRVDTLDDYSGFRVLAMRARGRQIDTLGHATTNRDGRFRMTVAAPERGIYSLTVWGRQGNERLAATDYVVAPSDSGTLSAELSPSRQSLRVESPENSALRAYSNAMATHRRMLSRPTRIKARRSNVLVQSVRLTSSVLWTLWENNPGTYAGQLAAVRSVSLLGGWNDSLAVARARQIEPSNPWYVDAVRTARRAEARLHGQQAALDLLDRFEARAATAPETAGVRAIRIQAFLDSLQTSAARSAAQQLTSRHSETRWAAWADRVQYEAEHLMPGMTAPNLTVRTLSGDSLSLRALRGHPVLLEYYHPGSHAYARQLPARRNLYSATRADSVTFLSISVEPDTVVNRAFLSNRPPAGRHVIAPQGRDASIVERYNVVDVPTRFLLDARGRIVAQYHSAPLLSLRRDLARILDERPLLPRP